MVLIISVLGISTLHSCIDDAPVDDLALQLDFRYFDAQFPTEVWGVVWTSDGRFIDQQKLFHGSSTFGNPEVRPGDHVTLGIVLKESGTGMNGLPVERYEVHLYEKIFTGQSLVLEIDESTPYFTTPEDVYKIGLAARKEPVSPIGSVTVNILPADETVFVSQKYGNETSPANGDGAVIPIYPGARNVLLSDLGSPPRHKLLKDVDNGQVINVAAEELSLMGTEKTFTFPGARTKFVLEGYESDWSYPNAGYWIDGYESRGIQTGLTTRYLDMLTRYHTWMRLKLIDHELEYEKVGGIPGDIQWPVRNNYSLVQTKPGDFQASAEEDVVYLRATWEKGTRSAGARWNLHSPDLATRLYTLPDSFVAEHPQLAHDGLQHVYTIFYKGQFTYQDVVDRNFKEAAVDFEYVGIRIMQE